MDIQSWKRILLHWINKCDFVERSFYNIDQSDIECFYKKFRECMNLDRAKYAGLNLFLKAEYPEYELLLDDDNALSSGEYIYVYSLMLHFSCVKSPQEYFHKICQQLHESYQQSIASFFQALIDGKVFSKSTIRHAIASIKIMSPLPRQLSIESPRRTPKQNRISPQTPKTFMLEERTRELTTLRAQLETERYEKGFLEVNLKQSEDKISKLLSQQKKQVIEIQGLRNELLERNTENCSPNKSVQDEQIKKRLLKTITQKETDLIKIREELESLREEKTLLAKKLSYSDQRVLTCLEKIKELDVKVDDLSSELEQKNLTISHLTETKLELEQFITEMRSSPGSRPDLNMSVECLDISLSRTTNSSGSISSPENLGVSVVDMQLRDKEHENYILQDTINRLRSDNSKLSKHISDIIFRHNDIFVIPADRLVSNELNENFVIFEKSIEKLISQYTTSLDSIKKMNDETNLLTSNNLVLNKKIECLEEQLEQCKSTLQELDEKNKELSKSESTLIKKSDECLLSIEKLSQEKVDVLNELAKFQESCDNLSVANSINVQRIAELTSDLTEKTNRIGHFDDENQKLQGQVDILSTDIKELNDNTKSLKKFCSDLETFKTALEEDKQRLNTEIEILKTKLGETEEIEIALKSKHLSLLSEYEKLKLVSEENSLKLEADLQKKEMEMQSLGKEISEMKVDNSTLSEKFNSLTVLYTNQQELLNADLNKLKGIVSEKDLSLKDLQNKLKEKMLLVEEEKSKLIEDVANAKQQIEQLTRSANDEMIAKIKDIDRMKSQFDEVYAEKERANHHFEEQKTLLGANLKDLEHLLLIKQNEMSAVNTQLHAATEALEQSEKEKRSLSNELTTLGCKLTAKENELEEFRLETDKQIQSLEESNANSIHILENVNVELTNKLACSIEENENALKCKEEEVIALKQIVEMKASAIKDVEQNSSALEENISSLTKQIEEHEKKATEKELCIEKLQTEISALRSKEESAQSAYHNLVEQVNSLKTQLEVSENQLTEINAEKGKQVAELQELVIANNQSIEDLEKEKTEMINLVGSLEGQLKELLHEHQANTTDLRLQLDATNEVHKTEKLSFVSQLEQSKKDLLEFETFCGEVKESLNKVKEENLSLSENVAANEALVQKLNLNTVHLTDENNKLSDEVATLTKAVTEKTLEMRNQLDTFENSVEFVLMKLEKNVDLSGDYAEIENIFEADFASPMKLESLKSKLNVVLNNLSNSKSSNTEKEKVISNLSNSLSEMSAENKKLNGKLEKSQRDILRLKEDLEIDAQTIENKLSNEISRLNENIQNLNDVCDKLNQENYDLQSTCSDLETNLHEVNKEKADLVVQLNSMDQINQEASAVQTKLTESLRVVEKDIIVLEESLIATKTNSALEIQNLKESLMQKEDEITSIRLKMNVELSRMEVVQAELKMANETLVIKQDELNELKVIKESFGKLEDEHKIKEEHLSQKCKENNVLNGEIEKLTLEIEVIGKELIEAKNSLDEIIPYKNKFEQLQEEIVEIEKAKLNIQRNLDSAVEELQSKQEECLEHSNTLSGVTDEKQNLDRKLEQLIKEIQSQNEIVTSLSNEIDQLRREKDIFMEERKNLCEKLSDGNVTKAKILDLETKIQDMQSKERELQVNLSKAGAYVSAEKSKSEDLQRNLDKLKVDIQKLQESSTGLNKRMEKQALKLGDSLAKASKFERENESLKKSSEASKVTIDSVQKENVKLSNELKVLNEQLLKSDHFQEQINGKLQTMEETNTKLQAVEQELRISNEKLKKDREAHETKLKKLCHSLSENCVALKNAELKNVELTLEIGSLNKTIQEQKHSSSGDIQEITENLIKMKNSNLNLKENNERLTTEIQDIHEENSRISDQLSKIALRLEIIQNERDSLEEEIQELKSSVREIRIEKENLEKENLNSLASLKELEMRQEEITSDRHESETKLLEKINSLEELLKRKDEEIAQLKEDIISAIKTKETMDSNEDLLNKLQKVEASLSQEKQTNKQINDDISILRAKLYKTRESTKEMESQWAVEREQLITDAQQADERIKELRLEFGGKLEKMKTKMKSLYNEQVAKTKFKCENEIEENKRDLDAYAKKIVKYEQHVQNLSKQIVSLTEDILELKKNNAFMEARLRDYESPSSSHFSSKQFKRPQSMHAASTQAIGGSIRMEDEEGELFNNTYLADLKNDRMTDIGRDSISVQELQYRNSLAAPHLKSTYLAQYQDHHLAEEDIKDGIPHSLDDSLSSLLNTGQRKKMTGTTSYKRPGPPTPSKNGGRLSFGGMAELPREVLKETFESNAAGTKKTPAKFNFFSSRLSMRDNEQRLDDSIRLLKPTSRPLGSPFSSTPRKSKVHYDHRRRLEEFIPSSSSQSENDSERKSRKLFYPDIINEITRDISTKWRQPTIIYTTESGTTDSNSPFLIDEIETRRKIPRDRDRRVSIYDKGNIYAKPKQPKRILREHFKKKAKEQRNATFNKSRQLVGGGSYYDVRLRKSSLGRSHHNRSSLNRTFNRTKSIIHHDSSHTMTMDDSRGGDDFDLIDIMYTDDGNGSSEFQKLLEQKQSNAPFDVDEINFNVFHNESRTLYGNSAIRSRIIPNVDTTMVRKSSFYVKSSRKGHKLIVLLNTHSTLSLIDLISLWKTMNPTAKWVLGILFGIVCIACLYLVGRIFSSFKL